MIRTKSTTRKYIFKYRRALKIDHKSVIQLSLINIRASSIISVIRKIIIWPWNSYLIGVDRLSAWPIIGADIKHFTDYRYRPF